MNQLVVLFSIVASTVAAPSGALHYAGAPLAYAHAAPVVSHVVEPAVYSAPALALTKTVHYAPTPVVTGYSSSLIKPNLGLLATPPHTVTKSAVLAPARAVDTVVPQVTHVQPEVAVKTVPYDVPIQAPYVSEVEVKARPAPVVVPAPVPVAPAPIIKAAPLALPAPVAAPWAVAAPAPVYRTAPLAVAAPAPIYRTAPLAVAAPAPIYRTAPLAVPAPVAAPLAVPASFAAPLALAAPAPVYKTAPLAASAPVSYGYAAPGVLPAATVALAH